MASLSDQSRARSPFVFVPSQISPAPPAANNITSTPHPHTQNENIDTSRLGRYASQLHIPPLPSKPVWQSKSPKITFGTANTNPIAPTPHPNMNSNQTQWPPRPPLQPETESTFPNDAYLDKLRIAEALMARDNAVERLASVCASVREKQLRIENLESERDKLKAELDTIISTAVGGKGVNDEEGSGEEVWTKQTRKYLDEIKGLEESNQALKNEIESLRRSGFLNRESNEGKNFPFLEDDSDRLTDVKTPISGTISPLLPFASLTLSDSQPKRLSDADNEVNERDKARYAVLSELPIPLDMPSDVLAPIVIPSPFTIHDFLGTITGPLKSQLSNYRVFQECTTTWCPEREEHGYYLTPAFKCITNPRVSTAHRWVAINLEANLGIPTECFFHKEGKWYYAGVYKLFKLDELAISEWEKLSSEATQTVIKETLVSRKNTSPQNIYETNQLYSIGALKVACVALQCVGFDEELYKEVLERAEACKRTGRWRGIAGSAQVGSGVGGAWTVGVSTPNLTQGPNVGPGGGTTKTIPAEFNAKEGEGAVTTGGSDSENVTEVASLVLQM